MDRQLIALVMNEWMRRYIEDPDAYEAEFQTVGLFLAEKNAGKEPSYGEWCAGYMEKLAQEIGG
jgi:hypothetical protein